MDGIKVVAPPREASPSQPLVDWDETPEEAEQRIASSNQSQYFALETAQMYRGRWAHFLAAGQVEAAAEARKKAIQWAYFFASQATSGGEGAALSLECNRFLDTLGPDPIDP